MRVYLAGPIQYVDDDGAGWRNALKRGNEEYTWVDPLDKYSPTDDVTTEWSDERIVDEDLELIDECDAILMHYEEVPSTGTPREIGYIDPKTGCGPNIPLVVQTEVPHRELSPWLTDAVDTWHDICTTFYEAIGRLNYYENRWRAT